MKVPAAKKLPSGSWHIQLRLGGQSVSITKPTEKECVKSAQAVKAQYLLDKKLPREESGDPTTLSEAIDLFISAKENTLSPLTIRGYRIIQKHRFQSTMQRPLSEIGSTEWQVIVNREAALCSQKTLKNAYGFIKSVVKYSTGETLPNITLSVPTNNEHAFLQPEEILPFVAAAKETKYAVPLLLALSSLRVSEISAICWEDIDADPDFIKVRGAVVLNEENKWVRKKENKNKASARNVPILIPELKECIERDRKASGPVLQHTQNNLRVALHKICKDNGLTDVTIHGLRHSFASLGYHLNIPEEIIMDIGGWNDRATMRNIYTHIAKSDITRYRNALSSFYNKNAHENAHE